MTIADAVTALRRAGVPSPESDARWLHRLAPSDRFADLVEQRSRRVPLQHLVGTVGFRHLELRCDRRALIPRPETEVTAGIAIDLLRTSPGRRLLDVGTGSGCIALAAAAEVAGAMVVATDVSDDALDLARENASRLGLAIDLRHGDLFAPVTEERFDVIVSNPPYLGEAELGGLEPEVRDHDPRVALVSGPTGLEVLERIVEQARAYVEDGGSLVLEIAPHQAAWARRHGTIHPDLTGRDRVLVIG